MRGMMRGGRHTYNDFGWAVKSWTTSAVTKRRSTAQIPGQSGVLVTDQDRGYPVFEERTHTVVFNREFASEMLAIQGISVFVNWLMAGGMAEFIDDYDVYWVWTGECTSAAYTISNRIAVVTATIKSFPQKQLRRELTLYSGEFCPPVPALDSDLEDVTVHLTPGESRTLTFAWTRPWLTPGTITLRPGYGEYIVTATQTLSTGRQIVKSLSGKAHEGDEHTETIYLHPQTTGMVLASDVGSAESVQVAITWTQMSF